MTFENTTSPPRSARSAIREHVPILLVGGGVIAAFLGLHSAATGVLAVAAVHVLIGVVVFAIRHFRASHQTPQEAG